MSDNYYRILRKMGGLQVVRCDPQFDAFMNGARWVNDDGDVTKPLRFDTREEAERFVRVAAKEGWARWL